MPPADDIDMMIDANTAALGIAIVEEWRATIRLHLGISLGHARNVSAFPLPDDAEQAPVFSA